MKFYIYNSIGKHFEKTFKKIIKCASKCLKLNKKAYFCVTFVSQEEIKEYNKQHRNIDKVTDTLSFPMFEKAEIDAKDYSDNIGDILICTDIAEIQAKELNHSIVRELCFLGLHSFLHLLGYDHIEKQDENVMIAMQKIILEKTKVGRDYV